MSALRNLSRLALRIETHNSLCSAIGRLAFFPSPTHQKKPDGEINADIYGMASRHAEAGLPNLAVRFIQLMT